MLKQRFLGFLGLLYKGGKITIGNKVLEEKHLALVICPTDLSSGESERILTKLTNREVEILKIFTSSELGLPFGKSEIHFIGIRDNKTAKIVKEKGRSAYEEEQQLSWEEAKHG